MIGVYVHIPYCRTKCPYCDFVSEATDGDVPELFIHAVSREIAGFEGPSEADSLFLGGGTPSLLSPAALDQILETLATRFSLAEPEITIEANPDDVTPDLLQVWEDSGINRVSLGVQSFDDAVLRYLERRHDANTARRACEWVAERFANWSMDLIFGARPVDSWADTLAECAKLAPPHVSTYGLTYEPSTPFSARSQDGVDDAEYLQLYWLADEVLKGLVRYEVSNFARPGFECRHNLRYWHNEEYAGFGPGAYSFVDGVRSCNSPVLAQYLDEHGRSTEALALDAREIRTETVIQHLRLRAGLPKAYYAKRFGRALRKDFGTQLDRVAARGLIEEDEAAVRPAVPKGFELNNEIGLALVQ